MANPKPDRYHRQKATLKRNQQRILLALKDRRLSFEQLKDEVGLSAPRLSEHLTRLADERYIEKIDGEIKVTNLKGAYLKKTKLYSLTAKGENAVKQVWWLIQELERMEHDIEIDRALPDSDRRLRLSKYSGHSQSSEWGAVYYPYEILIHSNKARDKNFNFFYELEKAYLANMERHILEKICSFAIRDGIIPLDIDTQANNSEVWAELSRKISNEYLLDDNAEIFVGFHTKIKDLRTWLLSDMGKRRLRAVLTDTPFPIDDWIGVNIEELQPILEIDNKAMIDKMDLKGLPIPKLPLRELIMWFRTNRDGQKYFSPFVPITYSDKLFQWMEKIYKRRHPNEGKFIAWIGTEEGQKYEKEGLEKFKKEQDRVNAHSFAHIGWAEVLNWLMSKDGQIYLKALSEIAPFPHQFHMFMGKEKGRWAVTPSKRVQAVCTKKKEVSK